MEKANKTGGVPSEGSRKLLDDCVAMAECLRVLRERGVACIDDYGISLRPEVFDRLFPGLEWQEHTTLDGKFIGIFEKTAEYRGFQFDTTTTEEDL